MCECKERRDKELSVFESKTLEGEPGSVIL